MGLKASHVLASVALFALMITLLGLFNQGIVDEYELTQVGDDPFTRLESLQLVQGVQGITEGIQKISSPTASGFDIIGGLISTGIGFLKTATGVMILPLDAIDIYSEFIAVPSIVKIILGFIGIIYIGFILIRNYTQQEN